jgi:hypothetical protein
MLWLWACSGGPGTMELIEARERHGTIFAIATAGVMLIVAVLGPVRRRGAIAWIPLALLAGVHPGIWFGARHGDCGKAIADFGLPYTIGAAVLAAIVYWRAAVRDKAPI